MIIGFICLGCGIFLHHPKTVGYGLVFIIVWLIMYFENKINDLEMRVSELEN